jgi:hypothetical protein
MKTGRGRGRLSHEPEVGAHLVDEELWSLERCEVSTAVG